MFRTTSESRQIFDGLAGSYASTLATPDISTDCFSRTSRARWPYGRLRLAFAHWPSFIGLQRQYPMLTTPVIIKAALALMVILHTNHTRALIMDPEAQRTRFPFIGENTPLKSIPEAANVAGPTFGGVLKVLNLVAFQPTETVLEYLIRIQSDQKNLTKHANVPWHELSHQTSHPIEDIIPAVEESMIFNWVPSLGPAVLGESSFQNMAVKQTYIRTKLGMLANAGAGGADGSQIVLFLQGALANMSSLCVEHAAQEMKSIAQWLAEKSFLYRQCCGLCALHPNGSHRQIPLPHGIE
ncbi:hypothetical protein N7489_007989 [Penicillium chrysogenum]|uniref:Uncharacterized protein n=1 Tax=Penicillium chrysogenum TaxID=5076 RepID=A0ABQ8WBR7_PENCH|nr:uncharacterized protein N7489_007989 [Penicillium chrysogenum]KAJ5237898.1 hypothetical protein N7489_007989 [Penicillium chrysogenum]KAJ5261841.1 hypothetical protein N7505_008708 [Penicillium chrysogenum]KAJ6159768.1 hypothetical protein N7497_004305 [Penicillium chrysogenum]